MSRTNGKVIFELFNSGDSYPRGTTHESCYELANEINTGRIRVSREVAPSEAASSRMKVDRRGAESGAHFVLKQRMVKWFRSKGYRRVDTEVSSQVGISDVVAGRILAECGRTEPHKVRDAMLARYTFALLPYDSDTIFVFTDRGDWERFIPRDDVMTVEDL